MHTWLFRKILFRPALRGQGVGREWDAYTFCLCHFICCISPPASPPQIKIKVNHCSVAETAAASMTCWVRYLSNNVNIVSPQLTVLTFQPNGDFSNIKQNNARYSLHSFSEFHSGKIALQHLPCSCMGSNPHNCIQWLLVFVCLTCEGWQEANVDEELAQTQELNTTDWQTTQIKQRPCHCGHGILSLMCLDI